MLYAASEQCLLARLSFGRKPRQVVWPKYSGRNRILLPWNEEHVRRFLVCAVKAGFSSLRACGELQRCFCNFEIRALCALRRRRVRPPTTVCSSAFWFALLSSVFQARSLRVEVQRCAHQYFVRLIEPLAWSIRWKWGRRSAFS